jgi:hypothetical protein
VRTRCCISLLYGQKRPSQGDPRGFLTRCAAERTRTPNLLIRRSPNDFRACSEPFTTQLTRGRLFGSVRLDPVLYTPLAPKMAPGVGVSTFYSP